MGFFDSVGSFLSGACSAVCSVLGSVSGSLGALATKALSVIGPWLGPVAIIISAVARLLGVFTKEDDAEKLGAKAMQPDTRKAEEFSSNAEYLDYLRNDVELDEEAFEKADEVEKLARIGVGTSIAMKGINEQKGFEIPLHAWVAMGKLGFDATNAKEIDTILDTFKAGGLNDFAKYVDAKLESVDDIKKVGDTLVEMYSKLEPEASMEDIESRVMNMEVGDIKPQDIQK